MPHVAMCQVTSAPDPAENLEMVRSGVQRAADAGASVVVFPEAMMSRFGTPLRPLAEPLDGPWASEVSAIAERAGMLVVAGMFTPADGDRVHNTLLITGRGHHLGYDKIHLYDAFGFFESKTVAPGEKVVTITVDDVTFGVATCYDVRFPALFQTLAEAGAAVVLLPASWGAGEGKREQWELLVRARALDSGSWVFGCGQADPTASGITDEKVLRAPTGVGFSLVADPFGRVRAGLDAGPDTLVIYADPDLADKSRRATGALVNRRPMS